jgi:hypothetical protein
MEKAEKTGYETKDSVANQFLSGLFKSKAQPVV